MLNCEFSDPINLGEISGSSDFEFSKMECSGNLATSTLPITIEKIVSQDQEREFFLEKSISYGDFLITSFFIILIIGFSIFFIRDFTKNRKLERL